MNNEFFDRWNRTRTMYAINFPLNNSENPQKKNICVNLATCLWSQSGETILLYSTVRIDNGQNLSNATPTHSLRLHFHHFDCCWFET